MSRNYTDSFNIIPYDYIDHSDIIVKNLPNMAPMQYHAS